MSVEATNIDEPKDRKMNRRNALATVGAISLTASAAVVALGSNMGLFGVTDTTPRVGNLSPIDAAQPVRTKTNVISIDDQAPSTAGAGTASGDGTSSRAEHRRGDDSVAASSTPTPTTASRADDHTTSDDSSHSPERARSGHDEDD